MTLEEIEESLPNGLHDSVIQAVTMDYEQLRLTLRVDVLIGLPGQPLPDRERYRAGVIVFEGVQFFSIEPPGAERTFQHPGSIWFKHERTPPELIPQSVAPALPEGTQCYSLFILNWFSSMHIAAAEVGFAWSDSQEVERR
jgi:hypothetical protein